MSRTQFSALLKLTLGGPANLNGECTLPAGSSVNSETSRFTVYACYFLKEKLLLVVVLQDFLIIKKHITLILLLIFLMVSYCVFKLILFKALSLQPYSFRWTL